MTWPSLLSWSLSTYWPVLIVAALSLGWRHVQLRHLPKIGSLQATRRAYIEARLSGTTLLPILTWGVLVNRSARTVMATHAWAQPRMMIASQQMVVVAILFLIGILVLDLWSRWLHARHLGEAPSVSLPPGSLLVIGLVILDWLLSGIAWWSLILEHGVLTD